MENGSTFHSNSKLKINDEPAITFVKLVLLKNVKLNVTGKVTGTIYRFSGAGAIVDVDERDMEFLLNRVRQSCCSGNMPSPYFEIVR